MENACAKIHKPLNFNKQPKWDSSSNTTGQGNKSMGKSTADVETFYTEKIQNDRRFI